MRIRWLAVLTLGLVIAGCSSGEPRQAVSNPAEPVRLRLSGSGAALPLVERLAEAYRRDHPEVDFAFEKGTNSGGAIQGVEGDLLDIAVVNRPMKEDEKRRGLEIRPFARDAIAFATRLPNLVSGVTTAQLRDIYGGALTDWSALGGSHATIVVLDRDGDESARRDVLLPLLAGRPVTAATIELANADAMVVALRSTPHAVGYTSLGLLGLRGATEVVGLALDGVRPNAESVSSGAYPWQVPFGLVHGPAPAPAVTRFIDYVTGPDALESIRRLGYAPPRP